MDRPAEMRGQPKHRGMQCNRTRAPAISRKIIVDADRPSFYFIQRRVSQNKQGRPRREVGPAGANEPPRYCDTAAAASLIACWNSVMESPNTRTVARSFF